MGDLYAAIPLSQPIAILPDGIIELRRSDCDLLKDHTISLWYILNNDMDSGVKAEHQGSEGTIET